jgi:hypothetical protein
MGNEGGAGGADNSADDSGYLTNGECVVWSDVAPDGLFDCGCCGVIDVPRALPEVVAVLRSDSLASAAVPRKGSRTSHSLLLYNY